MIKCAVCNVNLKDSTAMATHIQTKDHKDRANNLKVEKAAKKEKSEEKPKSN